MGLNDSLDLLFEIRELIEDNLPIHCNVDLVTRLVNHTNDALRPNKLKPTGAAHRDRLVAAALDVRSATE